MKKWVVFLTLVVIILGTWTFFKKGKGTPDPLKAPSFILKDAQGHDFNSSKEAAGKPMLVHFWASWCPPCLEEFPELLQMTQKPARADLQFVLISHDSKWQDAQELLAKSGAVGPAVHVLLDSSTQVAERFGTFQIPETYLISASGQVVAKWVGPQKWTSEAMRSTILQALQ